MINANHLTPPVTPKPVPSLPDLLEEIERDMAFVCDDVFCLACKSDRQKLKLVKAVRWAEKNLTLIESQSREPQIRHATEWAKADITQLLSDQRDVEGETKLEEEKAD